MMHVSGNWIVVIVFCAIMVPITAAVIRRDKRKQRQFSRQRHPTNREEMRE